MENLPNGFIGFGGTRPEGFESAGEASRRSRGLISDPGPSQSRPMAHARAGEELVADEAGDAGEADALREPQPFAPDQLQAVAPREARWAWAEIDLSAIRYNVAQTRRLLNPRCRLMAVVKADAYGHGAIEVSKAVLGIGAERLAVSNVEEGLALRHAGIDAPILVLSQPPASTIPLLLGYQLTPSVYTSEFAIAYGEAADLHAMKAPFHLAVNTGLNRIGVAYDQVKEFLYQISFHRALQLEGTFTHFASAESSEPLDFQIQATRFVDTVNDMQASGFDPGIVHAANTAAAFRYPGVQFDMARIGAALYGFYPCPETRNFAELRPAMSVHARITDVRMPGVSEGVSFGLHYRSPGSVKICTIPIGYADGLSRSLSGDIDFIIDERYVRQVGMICMDQCMFEVDMRHSPMRPSLNPHIGDEVTIVGSQGIAQITIDELAEKLGTIPNEVAIGFSHSLPRIYV